MTLLLAHWKQPPAQLFEAHRTPQGERQVDIAKLARALNTNALQLNRRQTGWLPSLNSGASSGTPISRRASARAAIRPFSSSSPRCATVFWITRRPT